MLGQRRYWRGPVDVGREAFTLLELLIVVALIGVLVGLLMAAVSRVKRDARTHHAKSVAQSIVTACQAYHTEYREWPVAPSATVDKTYTNDNWKVINALLPSGNPRKLAFIEVPEDQSRYTEGSQTYWADPFKAKLPYKVTISVPGNYVSVTSYGADTNAGTTDDITVPDLGPN